MFNSYFQTMSLARRLSLGFISVLLLLLAVAITTSFAIKLQGDKVQRIVQVINLKTSLANDLMESVNDLAIRSRSSALFTDMDTKQLEVEYAAAQKAQKVFTNTEKKLVEQLAGVNATEQERALMNEISLAGKKVLPATEESLTQALDADTVAAVLTLTNRVRPAEIVLRAKVTELIELQRKQGEEASADVIALQRNVFILVSALVIVALTAGGLIAWRITGSVTKPISQMQSMMTEIATTQDFTRRVPVTRMDEIGHSLVAFNSMIEKIQESSLLLKQKTADIQAMMHNIPQGILTIEGGNKVHPEFSTYLETILETNDIAGRDVMNSVFDSSSFNSDVFSQVEAAISACIGEDAMNFEFNEHLLVRKADRKMPDGRVKALDLNWSPIIDDTDTVVRLMLCVRDVTELREIAAMANQQKRELEMIGQILAINQEKFHEFIDSSDNFLAENKQLINEASVGGNGVSDPEVITQLFRNMHTIKGNARTYGLLHLTNLVHEAEQSYDELRKNPEAAWDHEKLQSQLLDAFTALQEYAHINVIKLGRKGPGRRGGVEKFLMVPNEHVQQALLLLENVDAGDISAMNEVLKRVRESLSLIGTENMAGVLAGVLDSLPSLAKELGKEPPQTSIKDNGIVIKNQVSDLMRNVFMHLYRNSLDHGIETAEKRIVQGKPAAGHIQLEILMQENHVQFKLRDDGRGLNLGFIKLKAIEQGLIREDDQLSSEQIAKLILAPGFSTAAQVTEVSGRGVGMDAVKAFVEREGGHIELCFLNQEVVPGTGEYRPFEAVISMPEKFAVQILS